MFINDNPHNHHQDYYETNTKQYHEKNRFIVYASIFFLFCIFFAFFLWFKNNKEKKLAEGLGVATSTDFHQLPVDIIEERAKDDIDNLIDGNQTEKIFFGDFYEQAPRYIATSSIISYDLPINVKIDVKNYYEISRKINLDKYIEDINKNGFAIIDQSVYSEMRGVDNFFDAHRVLIKNNIPTVLTSDFILYYEQNIFKEIYKDIQRSSFYENVWDMSRKMYETALKRYNNILLQKKSDNYAISEGARLELAFFATTLKILEPVASQIETDANLKDLNKFTQTEAKKYSFYLPDNLRDDVEREIALIRLATKEEKSPVMLYPVNYNKYVVPSDYKENAKLNNFYQAMRWMNSVFPLNYKSETCEQCLLDKEDWLINFVASSFITKDFIDNQELKNRWSVIYKFISFFSGIRNDLTYLHYNQSFIDVFGDNYDLESIYSQENENRDQDIKKIQEKLLTYNFLEIDGGLNRLDEQNKSLIGMRILQEAYWPNEYILKQFTGKDLINNWSDEEKKLYTKETKTACRGYFYDEETEKNIEKMYRCKASALDLINIFHPIKADSTKYSNYDYTGYEEKVNFFRNDFAKFNKYTWNSNIYWMLMDLQNTLFDYNENNAPIFYLSNDWETKRSYNTILGSWVNFHLESDVYDNYSREVDNSNLSYLNCNNYNYIEPNIDLINELIARNKMLLEMLSVLNINKNTNTASLKIKQLNKELEYLAKIVNKELAGQVMDQYDCSFLNDFLQAYVVRNKKNKIVKANDYMLNNSIEGLKLALLVYNYENKKVIAIGPIFNYSEY